MKRELFESFYKGNIEVIANKVCEQHDGVVYRENLDGVFEEYLTQRSLLKTLLKRKEVESIEQNDTDNKGNGLLDGHKVAACITAAIIKVRIIGNQKTEDDIDEGNKPFTLENASRMNEQVALFSGLSCLLEYMAENEENLYFDDESKINIRLPETFYPDKSTYLDSLVRALYYTNAINGVNPLLLAHIFFFIEVYHRQSIELEKFKQST